MSDLVPELLELPVGLDWSEVWSMEDQDGVPIVLTGFSYVLEIREKNGEAVVTGTVTVTDADAGEIELSLTAEQIATMSRVLHWVLLETDSLENETAVGYGPVMTKDIS